VSIVRIGSVVVSVVVCALWGDALAQGGDSNAPPAISIEQYLQANSPDSVAGQQFVAMRCAAINIFFSGAIGATGDEASASQFEKAATMFATLALKLETNSQSAVVDQIQRMAKMYAERAKVAKANTGIFSDDKIIRSDGMFCKKVVG
jgi:hypothetical protein